MTSLGYFSVVSPKSQLSSILGHSEPEKNASASKQARERERERERELMYTHPVKGWKNFPPLVFCIVCSQVLYGVVRIDAPDISRGFILKPSLRLIAEFRTPWSVKFVSGQEAMRDQLWPKYSLLLCDTVRLLAQGGPKTGSLFYGL